MKNVVLITVDSLRADYVYGSAAPNSLETLPQLASEGIHCTNAFSNAPYTKASFLSIMSGTFPWMFESVQEGYGPDRPHVANLLSDAGYATAGFHSNTYLSPTYKYDRGFDFYLGRDTGTDTDSKSSVDTIYNTLVERAVALPGISDVAHWAYSAVGKRLGIQLGSHLYKDAEQLNDAVVRWTRQTSTPAFVWVHYMDVHNPYYPHEGTVSEDISHRKAVRLFHRVNELRGDASKEDIDTLERLYRGEIEYLDRQLGNLFDRLDDTLNLDETLIAFTSDHGEAFGENGEVFHPGYALYDENIHIPLIIRGPGIDQHVVSTPVSNVDIVPTVLSNLNLEVPSSMVGEDLNAYASQPPENRLVFTEAFNRKNGYLMVTDGKYKLIRNLETGDENFHKRLETDGETRLAPDEFPEIRAELATALDDHVDSVGDSRGRTGDVEVTEDVRLQLRKLGYDE